MATDVERLVVSLEASITKFERTMSRANGVADSSARKIERRFDAMNDRMGASFTALSRGIGAAFAGAAALRGAQQLIDTGIRIENSLKVAGLAGTELERVYDGLYDSAQRNAAPVEALATLYGRAASAQKELGASSNDLAKFTENVAMALRVQGGDASQAQGALLQLGQALGSARVFAEEFNSINEGARPILQAAAAGIEEAGGSVSRLKQLVIEGKVSNKAFFDGIQAGAYVLEEKLAGAELTTSQGLVRLQNVLVDTSRKFNDTVDASGRFNDSLQGASAYVAAFGRSIEQNKPTIQWLLDQLFGNTANKNSPIDQLLNMSNSAGKSFGGDMWKNTAGELKLLEQLTSELDAGFDRFGASVSDADAALGQAEQTLASFASNTAGRLGEVDAAAQDLFKQVLEGKGSAELAAEAITALGDANPNFGPLLAGIGETIQRIYQLRDGAMATAAAISAAQRGDTSNTNISGQRAEQLASRPKAPIKPVSLSDPQYQVIGGAGGGGGGGGKSPVDRYNEALAAQEKRTAALQRESALQAQLNPLVNDYGFAMERLRAQMEMENAAKEAGLPLDEKRQQQIEGLATGYANATAEAGRLAEAQNRAKESADALAQAGRQALDPIVDGFLEGKDAGEVLQSVVKDLTRSLITMGLNAIGGGLFGGGGLGGIFGSLFGGFREKGGSVQAGKAYVVGEKRPEVFVPSQSGMIVPKISSMASGSAGGVSGPVQIVLEVQEGSAFTTRILQVSGPASAEIASRTVKGYDSDLGSRSAEKQARFG
jgi:tape measure domain-containing protein